MLTYKQLKPGAMNKQGHEICNLMKISSTFRLLTEEKNSVVLVRKRTIPTERPQPVGEVSANS
jgi:hypothetical protein